MLLGYITGRVFNGRGIFLPMLDLRQYHDLSTPLILTSMCASTPSRRGSD